MSLGLNHEGHEEHEVVATLREGRKIEGWKKIRILKNFRAFRDKNLIICGYKLSGNKLAHLHIRALEH